MGWGPWVVVGAGCFCRSIPGPMGPGRPRRMRFVHVAFMISAFGGATCSRGSPWQMRPGPWVVEDAGRLRWSEGRSRVLGGWVGAAFDRRDPGIDTSSEQDQERDQVIK